MSDSLMYMMYMILQRLYITAFSWVYNQTCGIIDEKKREWGLQIVCFMIPVFFLMIYGGVVGHLGLTTQFNRHLVGCGIILLIMFFSIDRPQKPVRWRMILFVPLIVCAIAMLFVSFIHPVGEGYRVFVFFLIIILPGLCFIWNNRRDYYRLYDCLSIAIGIVGIIYMIVCIVGVLSGYDFYREGRFRGTLAHAGGLSLFYTSVICSGLYLIVRQTKNIKVFLLSGAFLGTGTGMLMIGQGRSCILAAVTCIFAAVIFSRKNKKNRKKWDRDVKLKFFLLFMLSIFIAVGIPQGDRYIDQSKDISIAQVEQSNADADVKADDSKAVERFTAKGVDINQFSSDRIRLWTLVWNHLNLRGNDVTKQSIRDLSQNSWQIYAHNVFLEIAYRFGIPVGVLFLIPELVAGIIALIYLFSKGNKETYLIFPIMFIIVYAYESMLDCAGMPFILECSLYYYLSMIPMMEKDTFND